MSTNAKPHSPRQVLLGLFILFQIAFLIVSNLLGFVKWYPTQTLAKQKALINRVAPAFGDEQGHAWQWAEQLDTNLRSWGQLTGHEQSWALFAPNISKETSFPALLLRWDEPDPERRGFQGTIVTFDATNGFNVCAPWSHPPAAPLLLARHIRILAAQRPIDAASLHAIAGAHLKEDLPRTELLLSENEPRDLHCYVRIGRSKLRKFEGSFAFNPQPYPAEKPDVLASRLHTRMHKFNRDFHDYALSYMKWRLRQWEKANPGEVAPTQVIMLQRFFRIHGPDEPTRGLDGPYEIPMVRWLPDRAPKDGFFVLEPFDFKEQRFIPMAR